MGFGSFGSLGGSGGGVLNAITEGILQFYAPLIAHTDAAIPSLTETFTRDDHQYVPDFEGLLRRASDTGYLNSSGTDVPGFGGARLVQNLTPESALDTGIAAGNVTVSSSGDVPGDGITHPDDAVIVHENSTTAAQHTLTEFWTGSISEIEANCEYIVSVYAKAINRNWFRLDIEDLTTGSDPSAYFNVTSGAEAVGTTSNVDSSGIDDIGDDWYRCYFTFSSESGSPANVRWFIWVAEGDADVVFDGQDQDSIRLSGLMIEKVAGQTDKTPSIPWLASTGGFAYAWKSTNPAGTGITDTTLKGLMCDPDGENLVLHSRDFSDAAWTKTNTQINATSTACPDGAARTVVELEATANNGTINQSVTAASSTYTGSVYIKRVTGSGNVQISIDGGSTYSSALSLSTSWQRFYISQSSVTNPDFVIRLATSGDKIAIDFSQIEDYSVPTTPIVTGAASVTRNNTLLNYGSNTFVSDTQGMVVLTYTPTFTGTRTGTRLLLSIGGSNLFFYIQSGTQSVRCSDGTNTATVTTTLTADTAIKLGLRWSTSGNALQVVAGGTAGTAQSYAGSHGRTAGFFVVGTNSVGNSAADGFIRDVYVWNRDLGQACLEALTS